MPHRSVRPACRLGHLHVALFVGSLLAAGVTAAPLGPPVSENPIPEPIPTGDLHVAIEVVAMGLTAPNWGTVAPGDPDHLYVVDQPGIIWRINLGDGSATVFHDVSDRLVPLGVSGPGSFDERGLLGLAFHPDYETNGRLYTYTSEPVDGPADYSTMPKGTMPNHQAVIAEWTVLDPSDPEATPDPASVRVLLRVDEPQFNHNAGALVFDPDGMLMIAFGDGGGADDQDGQLAGGVPIVGHGPTGNGQDPSNPLGAILRIDPLGSGSANGQYGIPSDNPFADGSGEELAEIFAYGFRNPFRISFDAVTGELYAGDVGQNHIEEIDIVTAGGNYGWNHKEGTFFFDPAGIEPGSGTITDVDPGVPPGLIDPIAQYDHDEGLAVVGGFVYRGERMPSLQGRYVFGEFAQTFQSNGRLFYLEVGNAVTEFALVGQEALGYSLLGFGQDTDGELYALVNMTGTPFGNTGAVLRIAPREGDLNLDGIVDGADLGMLLAAWSTGSPAADLDGSGVVDGADLGILLAAFD